MITLGYILCFAYVFLVLFISGILKKRKIVSDEIARKIVHIFVSFTYIIMYKFMGLTIHMVIVPLLFVIINYISLKKNLFTGMEIDTRKSFGTVYYPISMCIMAIIVLYDKNFYASYGIGLFIMAFADGIAPIVANTIKSKKIGNSNKTISGCVTVLFISLLVLLIFNSVFNLEYSLGKMILVSILSMIIEFFSGKLDNLILPIGVSLIAYLI